MATVTKRDLIVKISNETGMVQHQVGEVMQKTIDHITGSLARGDDVMLKNFGGFHVRLTKPKVGRNPNVPDSHYPIPPRATVKFKPGKEMKQKVSLLSPELHRQEADTKEAAPARRRSNRAAQTKPASKAADQHHKSDNGEAQETLF